MGIVTYPPNPFPPSSENGNGGSFVLPVATAETLGGVKVGNGLSINENGVLSNDNPTPYTPKNYSTNEQLTGQKWIDGKDIYFKVINTPISLAQMDTWYSSGLTGVDTIINYIPILTRDGEQIGDMFNNGNLNRLVRNNELLVGGYGFNVSDTFVIAKQIVYYTKATV